MFFFLAIKSQELTIVVVAGSCPIDNSNDGGGRDRVRNTFGGSDLAPERIIRRGFSAGEQLFSIGVGLKQLVRDLSFKFIVSNVSARFGRGGVQREEAIGAGA